MRACEPERARAYNLLINRERLCWQIPVLVVSAHIAAYRSDQI